jgi:hypothetical protein
MRQQAFSIIGFPYVLPTIKYSIIAGSICQGFDRPVRPAAPASVCNFTLLKSYPILASKKLLSSLLVSLSA